MNAREMVEMVKERKVARRMLCVAVATASLLIAVVVKTVAIVWEYQE